MGVIALRRLVTGRKAPWQKPRSALASAGRTLGVCEEQVYLAMPDGSGRGTASHALLF